VDAAGVPVRVSSPGKVVFPARGWTKLDVAEHFAMCGEGALRNVYDRPTMLKRWTKGVDAEPFYVKRVPPQARSTVDVTFPSARPGTMFLPLEVQDVVWMAQMNCLDLHPWNARASDLDHPDELRIDLDPTEDPAHGEQQLALFNGHYGNSCYLPMLAFVSFDDEPDQYLVTALLRPGNSPDKKGAIGVLSRILPRLREAFPRVRFRVRLDAGFAAPDVLDFLDEQGDVEYAVAMGKNSILKRRARRYMGRARRLSRESGKTEHVYAETQYATKSWSWKRRIIIKAEVTRHPGRDPKDNPRFVVTNMTQTPRWVYEKFY